MYTTASITLTSEYLPPSSDPNFSAYCDTGYGVTLVNCNWLLKHLPHQKISTISTSLKGKSIGASKHKFAEFAALSLYFSDNNNTRQLVYTALNYEIHLFEGLLANLLISNDILSPEGVVIDIGWKSALIKICEIIISIISK